jgi:ferric-chelate reductase
MANNRLRSASQSKVNPRPSLLGLYSPVAFVTATLREMSYPQPFIFKRWVFLNPPHLGRVYFVAGYIILILTLLFADSIVSGPLYYETIAYRAAWCSVGQIPLIFLLAQKTSIVGALIGSSHERLNWLHRTVARCLLFTVTIHFAMFWREWSIYHVVESELKTMPMVKYGLSAYFVLLWIVFSSFAPIRNLRYEIFVVQHIISFIAFMTLIMLHIPVYARVYIYIAMGFYGFDRIVRTGRLVYRNLSIFHKNSTGVLSCQAHISALPGHATRVTIENAPLRSWHPGQHVFLQFPSISPLQSHPFTIASSPSSESGELSFVVRSRAGFSSRLYNRAKSLLPTTSRPAQERTFTVILDGPYGRPPNFLQYDTLVLIAGSSGVTFTVPILIHALQSPGPKCVRRIEFLWIVKSGSNFDWFTKEIELALQLADRNGIQLEITCCVTCDPTYTTNFPIRHPSRKSPPKECHCCQSQSTTSVDPTDSKLSLADEKADAISISSSSTTSSEGAVCTCGSSGEEKSPVCISTGRPDLRAVLDRNLRDARGETGVAVCGPQGLMARTRCLVAELSDERGAEKGTGAYGIAMFGEGFGW